MMKMKGIYRKTGMMVAVLALLVVLSAPTVMANDLPLIEVYWDGAQDIIYATVLDFNNQCDKYHQIRYYQPGTGEPEDPTNDESLPSEGAYSSGNLDGYFATAYFAPPVDCISYEDEFDMTTFGVQDTHGEWTVWVLKGGNVANSDHAEITSPRGYKTVTVGDDPYIPEFTTLAIPVVAILGLVAFYRRKQKK